MGYYADCAGGCGKRLNGSATSLPAGERTCRSCRRVRPRPYGHRIELRACVVCGSQFYPNDHKERPQLTCSRRCGYALRVRAGRGLNATRGPHPHPCETCKTITTRNSPRCGECAEVHRRAANQRKNLKRRAGGDEPMSIRELAERDRWRCHLCRRRVNPRLRWPHPRSASRDHLIPVVDGGTNDPANLALAHLDCNVRRRDGGNVQLQLVG